MFNHIDHIDIAVKNLEEVIDFYGKIGFKFKRKTMHRGGSVEFDGPDGVVWEFHKADLENGEQFGINHIAFIVDDINETVQTLRSRGIECKDPVKVGQTGRTIADLITFSGIPIQAVE